jgi:hypothetical protein
MKKGSRISSVIAIFNAYINNMIAYLLTTEPGAIVANWQRLTLTGGEITELATRQTFWHDDLYKKYTDPAKSTSIVKKDVRTFIKNFRIYANPLLKKMASCGFANSKDEAELNFVITPASPTTHTAPIAAQMFFDMTPLKGGNMRLRFREEEDSTRASIPEEANSLEVRWQIGGNMPNSVDDCPNHESFTEALFTKNFGAGNTTKKIFAFARWTDNTNKNRAGSWSIMAQTVIV